MWYTTTASPTRWPVTAVSSSATYPAFSWPSMCPVSMELAYGADPEALSTMSRLELQRPAAFMRTRISLGPVHNGGVWGLGRHHHV